MSGRRTAGTSRPSLGVQVLAVLHFLGKITVQLSLGKHLEVPDICLPDIRGLLNKVPWKTGMLIFISL